MKQLINALIMLAVLCCSVVSCSPSDEIDGSTTFKHFYTYELPVSSNFFQKAYIKGSSQYVLNAYYPGGNPLMEVFINGSDTIGIYFNSDGMPELITDGSQYLVLGSHTGHTLKCGVIYKDGSTELLDVETDVDWTKLKEQLNSAESRAESDTLADYKKEKLVNMATWSSIEIILKRLAGRGFGLGVVGSTLFLAEALAYSCSDDQSWLKEYSETINEFGLALTIGEAFFLGTNVVGLSVLTAKVWVEGVFYPLYKGGYFLDREDPESPYAAKIELLYKSVNSAAFATSSAQISWIGGRFEVELLVDGANFDPNDLEWRIVSEQPDWMSASTKFSNGHHSLYLNIRPNLSVDDMNQGSPPREHTVRARLTNVYNDDSELTFHVLQYGRLRTDPTAVIFNDLTTKKVMVNSHDEWEIASYPSWCKVARHGFYGFSVTPIEVKPGLRGEIVIKSAASTAVPYVVKIPVSCNSDWDGTSWNFSGKMEASGNLSGFIDDMGNIDNISQITNFGLTINNVAANDFSFSGDLSNYEQKSKISVDDKGRLVWTCYELINQNYVYVINDISIIFTRKESNKATGDLKGKSDIDISIPGEERINGSINYSGSFSGTLVQGD